MRSRLAVIAACLVLALVWRTPGVSPAALVAALAVLGVAVLAVVSVRSRARAAERARSPEGEPASVDVDAPAPARGRVLGWVGAGACACVAALLAAGGGRVSPPPLGGLVWALTGVVGAPLVILLGARARWRPLSLTGMSNGGGVEDLDGWRARVPVRWREGIRTVPKLARLGEGGAVLGVARIDAGPFPIAGGVALGVDLDDAWAVGEDVSEHADDLRRVLGAAVVLVEPIAACDTYVNLTVYRAQPFSGRPGEQLVHWRSLRAVPDDAEAVPVGEAAYADVPALGAGTGTHLRRWWGAPAPALSGRQATMSSRTSALFIAESDAGKTSAIRAFLRGLLEQGTPFRPYVWDNKGDYSGLREAIEALGGRYVTTDADGLDMLRVVEQIAEDRHVTREGKYEHAPTLLAPLLVVIVAEWQDAAGTSGEVGKLGLRIVRRQRGAGVILLTAAQLAEKAQGLGPVRDAFPQVVALHTRNYAQSKMALDAELLKRGASPHTIPLSARGVAWIVDRFTGWPYLARFAWIPDDELDAALVRPMLALADHMARRRRRPAGERHHPKVSRTVPARPR